MADALLDDLDGLSEVDSEAQPTHEDGAAGGNVVGGDDDGGGSSVAFVANSSEHDVDENGKPAATAATTTTTTTTTTTKKNDDDHQHALVLTSNRLGHEIHPAQLEKAVLTNLEDDISGNAPCPLLTADSKDMGKPNSCQLGHHSSGEPIDSPPPPTDDEATKHDPQRNEVTSNELFDREILFDDCLINIQAFDNGSAEARQKIQGWMNRQWIASSDKVLCFTSPVLRVFQSRYFWSSAVCEKRVLAIFTNPDVILILRPPKDMDEVRRLGGLESSEQKLHSFIVAESAADPKTCKIRLSQLTNITSFPSNTQGLLNSMNNSNTCKRKQSFFDVLTPSETITLSAACLPADSFSDEDANQKLFQDTHRCQQSIVSALITAHLSSIIHSIDGDQAWRHQVILGTIHSYVVSGNDQALKESLAGAFEIQKNARETDPNFIDAKDDDGKTALHYACSRRKNSTVRILVNAGADCSVAQDVDELTPCHICARGLDEKTLSIVLSASKPTRPDPNALDCHGRTPMYLAASEGKGDAVALDLCLSALDAWGGQMTVDSPKSKELLHPIHCASAQWKFDELGVILTHCNHRYRSSIRNGSDEGVNSLSAMFQYPIHAALISFRRRVNFAFQDQDDNSFNAEFTSLQPALIKTLRTLLEHGFEPNERIEGIIGQGEAVKCLSCYFGFTPLQILALVAVETTKIRENSSETTRAVISTAIQSITELLLMNGARINVAPPPPTRLDRMIPTGCYSLKEALESQREALSFHLVDRKGLTLDGNNEITTLLGGASRIKSSLKSFATTSKCVKLGLGCDVKVESTSIDSNAPGGSDVNSCAICWVEFGVISNRKHTCRVSRRYVCNDCSTKRVLVNGSENRISDGIYLLFMAEAQKAYRKSQENREEQMQRQRLNVTQARQSLGLKSACEGSASDTETVETGNGKLSAKEIFSNAISGIGHMKNAVLERGNKLERLGEKTQALEQASLDFANMAKELNRSHSNWW